MAVALSAGATVGFLVNPTSVPSSSSRIAGDEITKYKHVMRLGAVGDA